MVADEIENGIRYENAEIALNTGMILREMIRHEALARTLLYSDKFRPLSLLSPRESLAEVYEDRFYKFIDYIEQTTFGIACDAQANFKVCPRRFWTKDWALIWEWGTERKH